MKERHRKAIKNLELIELHEFMARLENISRSPHDHFLKYDHFCHEFACLLEKKPPFSDAPFAIADMVNVHAYKATEHVTFLGLLATNQEWHIVKNHEVIVEYRPFLETHHSKVQSSRRKGLLKSRDEVNDLKLIRSSHPQKHQNGCNQKCLFLTLLLRNLQTLPLHSHADTSVVSDVLKGKGQVFGLPLVPILPTSPSPLASEEAPLVLPDFSGMLSHLNFLRSSKTHPPKTALGTSSQVVSVAKYVKALYESLVNMFATEFWRSGWTTDLEKMADEILADPSLKNNEATYLQGLS
ncbi:uncharacterized protein LOC122069870 [Macadamia integrifolia]|uniref:uncharacterized protein LOC122069870 n=1 Tax=Macadamia integrifolia TaxID=60698 RepID=UPI001C4EF159|nr:uncharacterized protein LOC122069870 [Macadamia integrifolia]